MFFSFSTIMKRSIPAFIFPYCVLMVIGINMLMIGAKRRNFGIFVSAFYQTFNGTSLFELNMVGDSYSSLANILMPFLASLICLLNRQYQVAMALAGILIVASSLLTASVTTPGMLFLTHTLIHGIGSGIVLATIALLVGEYFPRTHRHHVLATSIAASGAYGVLLLTPLFAHIVQLYGWRESFRIIGAMFVVSSGLGMMFFVPVREDEDSGELYQQPQLPPTADLGNLDDEKPLQQPPPPQKKKVSKWKFCTWQHIKENNHVIIWLIDRVLGGIILFGIMMNLTEFSRQSLQGDMESSAMINIYLGAGEAVVFTVTMLLGDCCRGKLTLVPLAGVVLTFIFILVLKQALHRPELTNILTVFMGASVGLCNCVLYASSSEAMNIDGSISLPMSKMTSAIGALVSPFFSGMIIDIYSYEGLFSSLLIITTIRIGLLSALNFIVFRRRKFQLIQEKADIEIAKFQSSSILAKTYSPDNNKVMYVEHDLQEEDVEEPYGVKTPF